MARWNIVLILHHSRSSTHDIIDAHDARKNQVMTKMTMLMNIFEYIFNNAAINSHFTLQWTSTSSAGFTQVEAPVRCGDGGPQVLLPPRQV